MPMVETVQSFSSCSRWPKAVYNKRFRFYTFSCKSTKSSSAKILQLCQRRPSHLPDIRLPAVPSLPNDLGCHPVGRALHGTKNIASTHAEILKQNIPTNGQIFTKDST